VKMTRLSKYNSARSAKKVFCRLRRQNVVFRDTSFLKFRFAKFQK